jgi:hypothetical protein
LVKALIFSRFLLNQTTEEKSVWPVGCDPPSSVIPSDGLSGDLGNVNALSGELGNVVRQQQDRCAEPQVQSILTLGRGFNTNYRFLAQILKCFVF